MQPLLLWASPLAACPAQLAHCWPSSAGHDAWQSMTHDFFTAQRSTTQHGRAQLHAGCVQSTTHAQRVWESARSACAKAQASTPPMAPTDVCRHTMAAVACRLQAVSASKMPCRWWGRWGEKRCGTAAGQGRSAAAGQQQQRHFFCKQLQWLSNVTGRWKMAGLPTIRAAHPAQVTCPLLLCAAAAHCRCHCTVPPAPQGTSVFPLTLLPTQHSLSCSPNHSL